MDCSSRRFDLELRIFRSRSVAHEHDCWQLKRKNG